MEVPCAVIGLHYEEAVEDAEDGWEQARLEGKTI
jgi:hypothetical protein